MDGKADEFVGEHAAAAEAGRAVVVIHDGDAGAGADIVIGFEIEVADGAGVVVSLQMAADLVVAIAEAVGKRRLRELSSRRADSMAAEETMTTSASCCCRWPRSSK